MEKKQNIWIKILIVFFAIIVLLFFHNLKISHPIEGLITYLFKPLQVPLYKFNLSIFDRDLLNDKKELITENEKLQEKINQLVINNAQLKEINDEYKISNEQADFLNTEKYNFLSTKIINKFTTDNAQIITINQGKNKRIEVGMPVVADDGILIGKVSEVGDNISSVILLTSNITKVASQIQNVDNTPGLTIGQHGLGLKMELIPKGDEVKSGDIVITSGSEEKVPKGIVIGTIDQITEQPSDLFNSATVIPVLDYSRLSIVSVILN
jgi:rod shape-determining protein MreC